VNNAASMGKGSQDLYVNGNSNQGNNFQVDGAMATNPASNAGRRFLGWRRSDGRDGRSQSRRDCRIQIQTSQYDAGYGRTAGANVNVVTKSGSNDFHGAIFEFLRNDIFNANDFYLNRAGQPRPNLKQNQFGGVVGGPLRKINCSSLPLIRGHERSMD